MQPKEMLHHLSPAYTGAWLLTLMSCTHALPSRQDLSLSAIRRDIFSNFNIPDKRDASSNCCIDEASRVYNILDPYSSQKHNQHLYHHKTPHFYSIRKYNYNLEDKLSKRKGNKNDSIIRLLDIMYYMKLKTHKEKGDSQTVEDSNLFHIHNEKMNSSSLQSLLPVKRAWGRSHSRNVFVHGRDDRIRISPLLLRKFPFSNMVRLSTGCTGTLLTPFHVLTAAHCVHNGHEFRNKLEMLKVEIPDTIGVRVYYIEKIAIPEKWLSPLSRNERQAFYDYAVVTLSLGVRGRSKFLPLAVPSRSVIHQRLQFLGFPLDSFGLWRSQCSAKSNKALMDGNLILTRCDSAVGNSGAAVLASASRSDQKIIGVLSSTMPIGRPPYYFRYNIVTALTWSKLHDICKEIGQIGVVHGVCPSSEMIPKSRRFHINKVIPFFG